MKKRWTPFEVAYLCAHYGKNFFGREIAEHLGRTYHSIERKGTKLGLKSKLRSGYIPPRRYKTDHHTYRVPMQPYVRSGRMMIKLADGTHPIPYARYLWQQTYGEIPAVHIITHADNNPLNCDLSNLICLSRREQRRRNAMSSRDEATMTFKNTIQAEKVRLKYGYPQRTGLKLKHY